MKPQAVHRILLSFILFLMAVSAPAAQSIVVGTDCADKRIDLVNTGSQAITAEVTLVLASYPIVDSGCSLTGSTNVVQINRQLTSPLQPFQPVSLFFADLGASIPSGCDVYIATVRAAILNTSVIGESSCTQPDAGSFPMQIVDRDTLLPTLTADLGLSNVLDLNAIGGSCVGPREYVAQACNSDSTDSYRVTVDSKYVCGNPACLSQGQPEGDGTNAAVQTATLAPGQCGGINYLNDGAQAALPHCCDQTNGALQCAQFVTTQLQFGGGVIKAVRPAAILGTTPSVDGQHNTNCLFQPELPTSQSIGCVNNGCDADDDDDGILDVDDNCKCMGNPDQADYDGDGDGDVCDNCLIVYNPNQNDGDHDGIGDACDGAQTCHLCPAQNGTCDEENLGASCGKASCGGVCRFCNGQIGCYKAP